MAVAVASSPEIFNLTLTDRELAYAQFYIDDPRKLGGLIERAPKDAKLEVVESTYALNIPKKDIRTRPRCCVCEPRQYHNHGFVVSFSNGCKGLLGRDCGEIKHHLTYKNIVQSFDKNTKRSGLLRQVMASADAARIIRQYAHDARASDAYTAVMTFRQSLEVSFPRLFRWLQRSKDGEIEGDVRQRDLDAERLRDSRLDNKLTTLATRKGLSRDTPGVDATLLWDLQTTNDPDASKDRLFRVIRKPILNFRGHELFGVLPLLGIKIQRLEQAVEVAFAEIKGKPSDKIDVSMMERVRSAMLEHLNKAEELHESLEAALRFVEPTNIASILTIWNKLHAKNSESQISFDGTTITSQRHTQVRSLAVSLPQLTLTLAALERAHRAINDAYFSLPSDTSQSWGEVGH